MQAAPTSRQQGQLSQKKNIPLCHRQTVCPWTYPFPETALSSLIEQMGLPTATSARLAWHPLMAMNSHFQAHPTTPYWYEKGSCGGRIGRYFTLPTLPDSENFWFRLGDSCCDT